MTACALTAFMASLVFAADFSPAGEVAPVDNMSLPAQTPPEPPRSLTSEAALDQVFGDKAFAFCHDEKFPLSNREFRWCSQITNPPTACPKLKALCERGASAVEREPIDPKLPFELPTLPNIPPFVFWLVLALIVAAFAWWIVRNLINGPPQDPLPSTNAQPAKVAFHTALAEIETDVQKLLSKARTAAHDGDMVAAVAFAHAALLRRLEGQGLVRVHHSRTTSDYLRDLKRAAPEHQQPVAKLLAEVDRAQFAGFRPDPSFVETLIQQVVTLNIAIRPAALVFAVIALLWGSSCNLTSRDDWEHSPSGIEAVVRYLQATGLDARERLAPLSRLDLGTSHLILLPNVVVSTEDWIQIADWLAAGGQLILAPGPRNLPDWLPLEFTTTDSAGQKAKRLLDDTAVTEATLLQTGEAVPEALKGLAVAAPVEQTFVAPTLVMHPLLIHQKQVYAAALTWPQPEPSEQDPDADEAADDELDSEPAGGSVVVFADRNLFTNASLLVADNARFVRGLLDGFTGRVELAGELAGLVSPNPVASVGRGKLAPFMAQVALFLLVLFASRGVLFGKPRQVLVSGRRRFVEHINAVGLQFRRARAYRHVLGLLGGYLVERLRQRARLTGQSGMGTLAESLAKQVGRPVGDMARHLFAAKEDRPVAAKGARAGKEELRDQLEAIEALSALLATSDNKPRPTNTLTTLSGDVRITTTGRTK